MTKCTRPKINLTSVHDTGTGKSRISRIIMDPAISHFQIWESLNKLIFHPSRQPPAFEIRLNTLFEIRKRSSLLLENMRTSSIKILKPRICPNSFFWATSIITGAEARPYGKTFYL
uniref:Uncharacterized protein n=1 Tax=Lepeophtheirus salmonis TaxID=72036 RepID=A0A0K2TDX6_LEPSM